MSTRWAPPLPSLMGKAGPRLSGLPHGTPFQHALERYYQEFDSCPSFFERGVDIKYVRYVESKCGSRFTTPPFDGARTRYFTDYNPDEQWLLIVYSFYFRVSKAFKRRLKDLLRKKKVSTIKQWFYTADAVVLPYLLSAECPDDKVADKLTKFALENCANNYAQFLKSLKSFKKEVRKNFALGLPVEKPRVVGTYRRAMELSIPKGRSRTVQGRFVLLWTQTRAAGLANGEMIREAVKKLLATVTIEPPEEAIRLNPEVLLQTVRGFFRAQGTHAKISVGSTACLEVTREHGGKTGMLKLLTKHKVLTRTFDPVDLSYQVVPARSCRSSRDVLSWAIGWVLDHPTWARIRRVHAVAEPGKARSIGVPPYAVSVMFGVAAHIAAPTLTSKGVKSGLKSSRHLWNFLKDNLDPQEPNWQDLAGSGRIFALSTDEETATDYGDLGVSDQIWSAFCQIGQTIEGFPLAFFVLCKTLYKKSRIYLTSAGNGSFRATVSVRGWPMGDLFTKIILTTVNDYGCRLAGVKVYSLVGDDLIALSRVVKQLEKLLEVLKEVGMKISEADTFISHRLAFYCEEGTIVPQDVFHTPQVQMRRKVELYYLDYPRIRLMIPTKSETDSYSSSNVGRFSLLGKEAMWVNKNNSPAAPCFNRAVVLQHIAVPQEADTVCPFLPIEIGGDGAFPPTTTFLRSVVAKKSRNLAEVRFRMASLLANRFSHKLVRSERLDSVVHKHHLLLPKLEALEGLLPPHSVVRPQSEPARVLMNSVSFPHLERPTQTFVRLCKEVYYKHLFLGLDPPEPVFDISRSFGPRGTEVLVNFDRFRATWMDPGFVFHDFHGYHVDKSVLVPQLTTGLGWSFSHRSNPEPGLNRDHEIWSQWAQDNLTLQDQSMDDLKRYLNNEPLIPRVADRLTKYFESDVYVCSLVDIDDDKDVVIVTRDIKLGFRVHCMKNTPERLLNSRWVRVFCLDPILYLVGRTDEALQRAGAGAEPQIIEDAGSLIHCDFTEFQDGSPITVSEESLFMGEILLTNSRFTPWVKKLELPRGT